MIQEDQSNHQNLFYDEEEDERQSVAASARLDLDKPGELDPQLDATEEKLKTIQAEQNYDTRIPAISFDEDEEEEVRKRKSSKMLFKQKDRYDNQHIEKGMFNTVDQSVDQLKIQDKSDSTLVRKQSESSIKKRKPMKLNPIQNSSSIEYVTQESILKHSTNASPLKLQKVVQGIIRNKEIGNLVQFLKQSVPVNKKLVCILKRDRSGAKRLFPQIQLFMNQELKFLMMGKRKTCHLTSTYHLGYKNEPIDQQDNQYLSTVKSNLLGSEYNLIKNSRAGIELLATMVFSTKVTCVSVPRQVQVYVLSPFYKYADLDGSEVNKINLNLKQLFEIGNNKERRKILKLVNKKPFWDERREVWCMDFYGKALYSSVKNMILVDHEDQNKQAMILGKAADNVFNLEIMFPLSPQLAMAIAASSLDWKWASQ